MMSKSIAWLRAARLRTLPLSLSGIIVGTAMADREGMFMAHVFILALLTTVAFQVLSNFANDYGDGVKGTDNDTRIGPQRAVQSGVLTSKEMKIGVLISAIVGLALASVLIYVAFGQEQWGYVFIFFVLGLLSIIAAITYTVGGKAYGYRGLGDVFVFIFFGLLAVLGSQFLYTKHLLWQDWLPAITIGAFSTAVLNLNNIRDYDSDKTSKKRTLVVSMGVKRAKGYHNALILLGMLCAILYAIFTFEGYTNFLFVLAFVPLALHLKRFNGIQEAKSYDPELKKVALSTFLYAVLFYLGFNIFL